MASVSGLTAQLGYSSKDRLLIVHADDIGLCHSENLASFEAFEKSGINSGSIMVTCPWAPEAIRFAKNNPRYDIGLHLVFTCEWQDYRWKGLTDTKTLLDPSGYCYPKCKMVHENASVDDIETEMRAQIEKALSLGFQPSHLDSHMACLLENPEIIDRYTSVGNEYQIPVFLPLDMILEKTGIDYSGNEDAYAVPVQKSVVMPRSTQPDQWENWYMNELRNLKAGLNTLIVHVAYDNEEMQAVSFEHPDFGSAWRQRDLDFVLSPVFQDFLANSGIRLVTWGQIKDCLGG